MQAPSTSHPVERQQRSLATTWRHVLSSLCSPPSRHTPFALSYVERSSAQRPLTQCQAILPVHASVAESRLRHLCTTVQRVLVSGRTMKRLKLTLSFDRSSHLPWDDVHQFLSLLVLIGLHGEINNLGSLGAWADGT